MKTNSGAMLWNQAGTTCPSLLLEILSLNNESAGTVGQQQNGHLKKYNPANASLLK
jgi:hypothetical protein